MGSQGFEPRSWMSLASVLQLIITTDTVQLRVYFLQRQLESQMMPGYTITPTDMS